LDVVIERYDAVYGDIENETGEIGDVALEAFDKLIWCTPASMDGVRALLTYMLDDVADPGPPIPGRGQAEGASWFNRRCPDGGTPSGMI